MTNYWRIFIWLLKGNLIVWTINSLIFAILIIMGSTWNSLLFSSYFTKITLLETGIFFLAAGAIAFSGSVLSSKTKEIVRKTSDEWSLENLRNSEKKANKFIALAIILLIESIIISIFGF